MAIFAFAFWPFWITLCSALVARRERSRRILWGVTCLSLVWLAAVYVPVLVNPSAHLTVEVVKHSVQYDIGKLPTFRFAPELWLRGVYILNVTLPPMLGHFRHLGLYAYRAGFLRRYSGWPSAPLEQCEALEQLRALWMGEKIHVAEALESPPAGVDTEEDLQRVAQLLSRAGE